MTGARPQSASMGFRGSIRPDAYEQECTQRVVGADNGGSVSRHFNSCELWAAAETALPIDSLLGFPRWGVSGGVLGLARHHSFTTFLESARFPVPRP